MYYKINNYGKVWEIKYMYVLSQMNVIYLLRKKKN